MHLALFEIFSLAKKEQKENCKDVLLRENNWLFDCLLLIIFL